MKGKVKAGYTLARVSEVLLWIATAVQALGLIVLIAAPGRIKEIYGMSESVAAPDMTLEQVTSGFLWMSVTRLNGGFSIGVQIALVIAAMIDGALLALVFRRIWQIIKTAHDSTPFQKPVVEKVKQIGWMVIAIPLVNIAVTLVSAVICWPNYSFKVDVSGVIIGIVVLALSQIFAYGVKLEDDMEGLL